MAVIRAQIRQPTSQTLVRDDLMMTPHFDFGLPMAAYQDFAEDLAKAVQAWQSATNTKRMWAVTLYDTAGPKPHYPLGHYITEDGSMGELGGPREMALCLSFYSEHNRPRHRGRVYTCPWWCFTASSVAHRPSDAVINKTLELGTVFKDAGGPDVDWVVWSRADQQARPVTNYWVDDEWDVQRRRGQKATKRVTGVTSEAQRARVAFRLYSERILSNPGGGITVRYTVPFGRRVVITCIASMTYTTSGAEAWVGVGGVPFWFHAFPGQKQSQVINCRAVAYGGEYVEAYASVAGCRVVVSGYIFDDPPLAGTLPAGATVEHIPGDTMPELEQAQVSDAVQHALLALIIAATAYLEWRRQRERRIDAEDRAERLRAAAERGE